MRRIVFIISLFLSAPLLAAEPLSYTETLHFTWARIPLGQLTLTMQQEGNRYSMQAAAKTEGMVRLFSQHESLTKVEGIYNEAYLPTAFTSDYVDNGEKKQIALRYDAKGLPIEENITPPREESRPLVPPEMKQNTVDILTGFFAMREKLKTALANDSKEFAVTIYDGKRLFKVTATLLATNARIEFKSWKGSRHAVKLSLQRQPLAGYKEKELKKLAKRNPAITLYVEPKRLVPFGLSFPIYGAKVEAWPNPPAPTGGAAQPIAAQPR